MAKRKRYPKLPNGFGSIKYLGPGRRNPFAVHPPTTAFKENGSPVTPKALDYVDDWYYGFSILMAYKAGTYVKGEYPPKPEVKIDDDNLDNLVQHILADYGKATGEDIQTPAPTFKEVYEGFYKYKYEEDTSRTYSESSKKSTKAAFQHCATIHNTPFEDLRHDDLQRIVNNCGRKHATHELIVSLFHQMYAYADMKEICKTDYSAHVRVMVEDDDEGGVPFTDSELKILWDNKDDEVIEFILIMCYSGFRITAYKTMDVNLKELYFKGGVKTKSSKDRMVPIHSGILPLVKQRIERDGSILNLSVETFRQNMYTTLKAYDIEKHTPHDCRHTFSKLCEDFEVKENDRKRMLGHSFTDITNAKYGHRDLESLKKEIEKIKICY